MRLDPDDPLTELIPLDEAPQIAGVTRRTLNRWVEAGRLRVVDNPLLDGRYVIERELLDVEHERWKSRTAGRPGARVGLDVLT